MNSKWIKAIGIVASVGGALATVAGSWATKKETDSKITEEVAKAVTKALEKKES